MSEPAGTIRAERPDDAEAIALVVTEAFGRTDEADLVARLRREHADGYGPSLVAEVDGVIVGHVLLSDATLDGDPARPGHGLAPGAVMRTSQHLGIGSTLVVRVCDLARVPVVVLGEARWYRRLGFEPAIPRGILPPWEGVDEVWSVRFPPGEWNAWSGTVRYPAAFDDVPPAG